jgi:hypothetical protein
MCRLTEERLDRASVRAKNEGRHEQTCRGTGKAGTGSPLKTLWRAAAKHRSVDRTGPRRTSRRHSRSWSHPRLAFARPVCSTTDMRCGGVSTSEANRCVC